MKTHVTNDRPRIIQVSPNGMFGVPDLEPMAAKQNPRMPRIIPLSPNRMFGVLDLESMTGKQNP